MFKRRIMASIIIALAMAFSFGVAAPSSASAAKSQCSAGFYCIWMGKNYTGGITIFAPPTPGHCTNFVSPYDNNAESVYNHTSGYLTLWPQPDGISYGSYTGYGLLGGSSNADLSTLYPYFNGNIASSLCNR